MLKIHDGRKTNEIRLYELECGKFFVWKDLVFRRINFTKLSEGIVTSNDEDGIMAMLMTTGEITYIDRNEWIEPIPDRQIYLEIED